MQSLWSRILCKAYEVGFDFALPPNNYNNKDDNDNDTHPNLAASHTGEGPSCISFYPTVPFWDPLISPKFSPSNDDSW